jgi:hypothetical protein
VGPDTSTHQNESVRVHCDMPGADSRISQEKRIRQFHIYASQTSGATEGPTPNPLWHAVSGISFTTLPMLCALVPRMHNLPAQRDPLQVRMCHLPDPDVLLPL